MDPIQMYLADGTLPAVPKEADRVKKQANWFILYDGILYKCSCAQPLLRCVTPEMGKKSSKNSEGSLQLAYWWMRPRGRPYMNRLLLALFTRRHYKLSMQV